MYIRKQSNGNGSSVSDKLAHKVENITWEIVQ